MVAFAANSLLCRIALGLDQIDPATFTSIRVASAALTLTLVVLLRRHHPPSFAYASAKSTVTLLAYIVFFSFAYNRLAAGTGALVLFGAVQLTMFIVALRQGEPFPLLSWAGLALAIMGLIYLVMPGVTAPDPLGALFMAISGSAWGFYSLFARGVDHPVEANASNFIGCLPLVLLVSLVFHSDFHISPLGIALAVGSGAVASGAGYVIWYAALRGLTGTQAATVQLSVPALAAFGGIVFLAEPITQRLVLASVALLGGVAIVLMQRRKRS